MIWELFWNLPDHFIWAWWCSFLTVVMVLWAVFFPVTVWNTRLTRGIPKEYIMEPRELVETSPPFLGSGQSIPPLGADTDKSRWFWECAQNFPKATSCCSSRLLFRFSTEHFHPPSWPWEGAELKCCCFAQELSLLEMVSLSCSMWGDTYVTKARCPVGDTPSPCHMLWQTGSPLLRWHLAQMSQLSYLLWRAWGILNFKYYCVFC